MVDRMATATLVFPGIEFGRGVHFIFRFVYFHIRFILLGQRPSAPSVAVSGQLLGRLPRILQFKADIVLSE